MKLIFNRTHKSITASAEPIELPGFTVLTGVNGAGKSHLLEAIENNSVSIEGIPANQDRGPTPIRRFDWSSLVPQDTGPFSSAQVSTEQASLWHEFSGAQRDALQTVRLHIDALRNPALSRLLVAEVRQLDEAALQKLGFAKDQADATANTIRSWFASADGSILSTFTRNDPLGRSHLIERIFGTTGIAPAMIKQEEFLGQFPRTWQPVDLFQQSFARLFSGYQRAWQQNRLHRTGYNEGAHLSFLSDEEFLKQHGTPPWDVVNQILESAGIEFRINEPDKWRDFPYEPVLTDTQRGTQVKFNDLSSGERILMSFALCLYNAGEPTLKVDFPKVLLFDEVDAPLHPSMTKAFLRTIREYLVDKHSINVVLTTHSPSTVALAPEQAIHVMVKTGPSRIRRSSKDEALRILTAGVPTLSVSYENRRQVFVEGRYDVSYYSGLYERCKDRLTAEVSLTFIASAEDGNCDQVKSIVQQLHKAGNRTVKGIVDWDAENTSEDSVFVLAEGLRYSIDNAVLDPVLLAFLLVRERIVTSQDLGLPDGVGYMNLHTLTDDQLQRLADAMVARLKLPTQGGKSIRFSYSNTRGVDIPGIFARMNGHDLEKAVKDAIPELRRFKRESELKLAIIEKVIDDHPMFMPDVFIDLFRMLQK